MINKLLKEGFLILDDFIWHRDVDPMIGLTGLAVCQTKFKNVYWEIYIIDGPNGINYGAGLSYLNKFDESFEIIKWLDILTRVKLKEDDYGIYLFDSTENDLIKQIKQIYKDNSIVKKIRYLNKIEIIDSFKNLDS